MHTIAKEINFFNGLLCYCNDKVSERDINENCGMYIVAQWDLLKRDYALILKQFKVV